MKAIEEVLADAREEAAILRRNGHAAQAETIERIAHDIERSSAFEYLTWLTELDARRRSGHSVAWLRARFPEWERGKNARWRLGKREYRMVMVPQRANESAAFEEGRKAS